MANDAQARILIVEDEPDMNNLLADVLRAYGFEPIQAIDAEAALRAIAERPPDAILLDLMLPGMSGLELCRLLKSARSTRSIPVVILTALDRAVDRRHGFETGADDYLTKPFTPEGLIARLRVDIDQCREIRNTCNQMEITLELTASLADLKAANTLATCLYCRTDLAPEQIESLRAGIVRLSNAAGRWAVTHGGASPVRLTVEVGDQRMLLKFRPIAESGEAFLLEHLDPEAAVPAALTDAGIIDSLTTVNGEVVLEKTLPPPLPEDGV
ncbi:MAG: response regulator [Planctomycetota bacterium]|nr:response regulator [Planctomycetota bacterium]